MRVGSQVALRISSINNQAKVEIGAQVARLSVTNQVPLICFTEALLVQAPQEASKTSTWSCRPAKVSVDKGTTLQLMAMLCAGLFLTMDR